MPQAVGRIGDQFLNRCSTPVLGVGSANVFVNSQAVGTIGSKTLTYEEIVPCKECCRSHQATVIQGSPTVFVNGKAMLRIGDKALGITGSFPLLKGSPNVFAS
jgi:uncharacterized Zn-binding protein involved in type VI secretion